MIKSLHFAAALALAVAPIAINPAFVGRAEAATSKPTAKPPKPPSKNGVCWHWSHGKWTAHPC